jgi:hypothetical protein
MWIRRPTYLLARMPSTRPSPSAPRPPAAAAALPPAQGSASARKPNPAAAARSQEAAAQAAAADGAATGAARAGGFHESSYELQSGLQVSESEWPDDVTVPGALGER